MAPLIYTTPRSKLQPDSATGNALLATEKRDGHTPPGLPGCNACNAVQRPFSLGRTLLIQRECLGSHGRTRIPFKSVASLEAL